MGFSISGQLTVSRYYFLLEYPSSHDMHSGKVLPATWTMVGIFWSAFFFLLNKAFGQLHWISGAEQQQKAKLQLHR